VNATHAAPVLSAANGFLPDQDPILRLPSAFDAWEDFAHQLPKFLCSDRFRDLVKELSTFPIHELETEREWERAMVLLSYIGHAYVWTGQHPAHKLPAILAVPWAIVAKRLGRPPVLSYSSYCLQNYRRLEPGRAREVGNIALNQTFYAGIDEEWFVLIHVDIEQRAAPALAALSEAQYAKGKRDGDKLLSELGVIGKALGEVNATMNRMPEFCDPYIYYHRVRPYIHGWRNHPAIPEGVLYEGVEEFGGKPQTFRGETGAQSSIVPALDAVLGVGHAQDVLRDYLMEMRTYMPPAHRAFIEAREAEGSVRDFAIECGGQVVQAYDHAVSELERFRSKHLEYAATYIFKQGQTDGKNPHAVGTGGTPFMPYLKKHRDETTTTLVCPASGRAA